MFIAVKNAKVSTVTSLSDLRLGSKGQRKVKFQTTLNRKIESFNMFTTVKYAKVSTVTFLSDLRLGVKRSKKGQISNNVKLYN